MSPESKNKDTSVAALALPPGSAGIIALSNMGPGVGTPDVIGRRVTFSSLHWRFISNAPLTRLLIVYDKQSNGTQPALLDVLASPANYTCPMNLQNSDRFIIIHDRIYSSFESGATNTSRGEGFRKISLEGIVPGAGGLLTTGNITAYMFNPDTLAHTADVFFRLRYTDM